MLRNDAYQGAIPSELSYNVFINGFNVLEDIYYDCSENIIGAQSFYNTFGGDCHGNILGENC